jgi:N-acetylmuramoyl-L-alanine amidase
VVAAVLAGEGAGVRVRTPCGGEASIPGGTPISGATVVLDPGHGGAEPGAVGANGLTEKELNLLVAERTKAVLEAQGATVVLTRTSDYRITLGARADIVKALAPPVFISIHHNGGGDGPSDRPGTETYYQIASPESRRLAGLVYEELLALFSSYEGTTWMADTDAGAKYRTNSRGGDYYGMLRQTAGVTSVLSEALFISNVPEAELLARPEVQQAEAEALARAVTRHLSTADPGSGFTEPYPRTDPAGPGGGGSGCVDPPLA